MIWVDHIERPLHAHARRRACRQLSRLRPDARPSASGSTSPRPTTAATARFYIDGVEVASRPSTGDVGNSNTWRIGAYGATPTGFFDGLIDNVRIYDRALSASEIQADMASPDPAPRRRRRP